MTYEHKRIALLDRAESLADERGMEKPEGLLWALKTVAPDFTAYGRWRWPFPGSWAEAASPNGGNRGPCPSEPGDGLCVGLSWRGMAAGGRPAATLLLCGFRAEDVLGWDAEKARVSRAYVRDVVDGFKLVRDVGAGADLVGAYLRSADLVGANLGRANLGRANLEGADLGGADLVGAYLRSADLVCAYLGGADLGGADLEGADLRGADLRDAKGDHETRWPAGFDPAAAGAGAS